MRGELRAEIYRGRAVRTADYADGGRLRPREAEQHRAEEREEHAQLCRRAKQQAFRICKQRSEIGHCADAEEYQRRIYTGLDADIEEIQQTGVAHNVAVAVIIGACLVQKRLPQLRMIQRVFAETDEV